MKANALRILARQLRADPNPDAVEDAAAALEACARERDPDSFECYWNSGTAGSFNCFNPDTAGMLADLRHEDCEAVRDGKLWRVKQAGLSAWLTPAGALAALEDRHGGA